MAIRRNTSLIAIDFGAAHVRLLQIAGQQVTAMELPCDIFAAESDPGAAASGGPDPDFRRVIESGGFHGRRCTVTLPATCFLSDTVLLPELNADDRVDSLGWEAVDHFGVEHDDVSVGALRFRAGSNTINQAPVEAAGATPAANAAANGAAAAPAPAASTPSGAEHLLLALRRATAMRALNPLMRAELSPVRLESAALAGLRCAWAHWSRTSTDPLAFVHVEPTQATFILAREGELLFHRAIAGQYQVARTAAAASDPDAIPLEARSVGSDRRAFRWSGLADEILQCLRHVERRGAGQWPAGLITSGPCAGQVELLATLESICGVPSHPATAIGVIDPLPATLSPSVWASALGAAAIDLEKSSLVGARRAA